LIYVQYLVLKDQTKNDNGNGLFKNQISSHQSAKATDRTEDRLDTDSRGAAAKENNENV
jgi:hypothetical protein